MENIPREILWKIGILSGPRNVVALAQTCKDFRRIFDKIIKFLRIKGARNMVLATDDIYLSILKRLAAKSSSFSREVYALELYSASMDYIELDLCEAKHYETMYLDKYIIQRIKEGIIGNSNNQCDISIIDRAGIRTANESSCDYFETRIDIVYSCALCSPKNNHKDHRHIFAKRLLEYPNKMGKNLYNVNDITLWVFAGQKWESELSRFKVVLY